MIASALRGTSTILAGIIAALLTHSGSDAFVFGLAFGTMILLLGLILQSIQYWVVLLKVVVQ